jgi:transposase
MYLGSLDLPKPQWRALAVLLEARITGQASLFEADPDIQTLSNQVFEKHEVKESLRHARLQQEAKAEMVQVDLASATTSKHRSLGPELVANAFFDRLGITAILKHCGLSESQQDLAKAVIIGRLIEPGSDLSTWRWMRSHSSLPEFLNTDLEIIGKDAVYEIADRLWLCKDALEKGLRAVEGILFPCEESVFLYDLTNTYFEGTCSGNKLAKRGKSKEKRSDCPLVTLALAVDAHGFPLFSQIYEGNQSEPATLIHVLDRLEADSAGLFQSLKPTLIMDRGIATADNLALIQARHYPYLLIERRDLNQEFTAEFERAREDFEVIAGEEPGERVYVKKLEKAKDESELESTRLLCFSEGKAEKESGIDTLKDKRFREDLTRLQKSVEKGAIQAVDKVNQRIGRLRERYPSIAKHYEIGLNLTADGQKVTSLTFEGLPSLETRINLQGCYVIQTSHHDLTAEQIWKRYTTLTRVESAFRALKSDLGFRPVRHHIERRTQAHLFISVLAYHLLATIEQSLLRKGDHRSWATIKKTLETHQRSTLSLRGEGRILHQIRLSSTPETAHQQIYRLLDIKDPLPRTRIDRLLQM